MREMKKSFTLLRVFCGLIALLAAPGIGAADEWVFPSYTPGGTESNYRDFSVFFTGCLDILPSNFQINAIEQLAAAQVKYTPLTNTSPGWIEPGAYDYDSAINGQHTYVINLPSPTGPGYSATPPGLHPGYGVPGLLVLTYTWVPQLPTTVSGFKDPAFLNNVAAVVNFEPGVSTAWVYERQTSVPEPGALLLLGFGLIALVGIRRVFIQA
jgi:hypothetical protein